MPAYPLISLVVPFYNEEQALPNFYREITSVLSGIPNADFEIVCVDDGSRDRTVQGLIALGSQDSRIVVVELSRNYGKEAAITAGLEYASGAVAIIMDADLQDPPELIPVMIQKWQDGAEMVLAKRTDRSTDTFFKRWSAHAFYKVHNRVSTVKIPEDVGDFRLLSRKVIDAVMKLPERHRFMKGLFAWVGFRTEVVEYARPARTAGKTKFSLWKLWKLAVDGIYSFSTVPLRAWTTIGAIIAAGALLYALKVIIKTWIYGVDVPGYASIIVAVLFLGGVQLIALGVMGDYIGRVYNEVKRRPLFIVRDTYRFTEQRREHESQ